MENMEENSEMILKIWKKAKLNSDKIGFVFFPYFPYLFTIQLTFLPYFPYLITIQLGFLPYFPYLCTIFFCIFQIFSAKLNSDKIGKIRKKSKLNSEKDMEIMEET
jgi:hypothetical protein